MREQRENTSKTRECRSGVMGEWFVERENVSEEREESSGTCGMVKEQRREKNEGSNIERRDNAMYNTKRNKQQHGEPQRLIDNNNNIIHTRLESVCTYQ